MSDITKKVLWRIGLSIPNAIIGYVLHKVFQAWGIFDPLLQWLGAWLKVNITSDQAGWTAAAIISIAGYMFSLWFARRYFKPLRNESSRPIASDNQTLGTINQSGNAASRGQSGGVTAGMYINQAPITAQQKDGALSSLQYEIEELSEFPNRPDISKPRTLLEQHAVNKLPHQLFIILNKYYKETIKSLPKVGEDLVKYKKKYSDFESGEYNFENEATTQIGKIVSVRYRQAWLEVYFRYFLLRSDGLTQQQIIDGGSFLNWSITWDEAERVFNELTKNPAIGQAMAEKLSLQGSMLAMATSIINAYQP